MKSKNIAALLSLFLGGFGVHKFYLGNRLMGIIYLAFFWTSIPALISFFEALNFVFMSEKLFNERYNLAAMVKSSKNIEKID